MAGTSGNFGDLSDGAAKSLIDLFHACEATGFWPMAQQSLHVLMLPKPDGKEDQVCSFGLPFVLGVDFGAQL